MENEHYEPDTTHPNTGKNLGEIYDAAHDIAAHEEFERGDFAAAMREADILIEGGYHVPFISHAALGPHICVAYLNGYKHLIVVSSTQVPYHTRRQLAAVLELPISRIQVVKPRVGGALVASYTRKDFASVRYITGTAIKVQDIERA